MCFGNQPTYTPPEIVYQGPSEEDLKRQADSLAEFKETIRQNQEATAASIQQGIDAANERSDELSELLATETARFEEFEAQRKEAEAAAAAAASANYTPTGAYGLTASVTEPKGAQTTEEIKPKKKNKDNLKITSGATEKSAGSGLNIGL